MSSGIAMVTGASAGIGAAFTRRLAQDGYDLVLVARNRERLSAAAEQFVAAYGVTATVLTADLATDEGVDAVAEAAHSVDLLVNNAGFGNPAPFGDALLEDELRMLKVHCESVLRLTSAAVDGMGQRDSGSGRRRGVINVASVGAYTGRGSYDASKAWVVSFSLGAAADLATRGRCEHVMALCPGFTKTEFHERAGMNVAGIPKFMWLNADRVAADAMRDFRRGTTVSIPGAQYKAIVTLARVVPPSLAARLTRLGWLMHFADPMRAGPLPLLSPVADAPGEGTSSGEEAQLCLSTSELMCTASGPRWRWSPGMGRCS